MGILSDLIRAPIGQAPSRSRGMGGLGARPDVPSFERMDFRGQPLQAPIAMPRNPSMVEDINRRMLPPPVQSVTTPQPFLQQPQVPQTGGIPVTGGGPLGSGILPVDNLPAGTPPVMGPAPGERQIPTGPAMGGIRTIPTQPSLEEITNAPTRRGRNDFMSIAQDPNALPYEMSVLKEGQFELPEPDMSGKFTDISDNFVDTNPFVPDYGFGPGIMPPLPDFMEEINARGPVGQPAPQGKMPSQATLDNLEELRNNPGPGIPVGFGSYGPGGNLEMGSDLPGGGYLSDLFNPGLPQAPTDTGNDRFSVDQLNPPEREPTMFTPGVSPLAPIPPGLLDETGLPPVDPNITGVTQPDPNVPVNPTQTQMPMGAIDPVLLQQQTSEKLTDPLLRSLYFGTQDSPGFYQQLQQAGSNLIGSDVPLQQTAGLTPLELLARQQAVAGIGGFEPFLQQNRDLVNQGIAQSRRAEQLQDPYYTQAEEIYKDTMGAYDPSMTQQFYNPYEDAVVQQTIDDTLKAGDKQDIASRAREISSGAFGGSRARLGAEERRESLGRGLAQALGNIRSQGFQTAQNTGLGEFARQQQAKRTGAQGLMGIGVGRGSAASQLGSQLAGYGSQIGGIGQTQEQMRAGQRGELAGFGGTGRGIAETGLGRIYQQQLGQQQRPLGVLGQIGSMLPGYQASQTQIDSGYGMPTDPTAAGLGAAFSAYGALAPRQGQT